MAILNKIITRSKLVSDKTYTKQIDLHFSKKDNGPDLNATGK